MDFIKVERSNILKFGILDKNDQETGEYIEFDVEDLELPERMNECSERHYQNVKKIKADILIIEKRPDQKIKGSFLTVNEKAKLKALKEFYRAEEEALDLFLGEGGTKKMLCGKKPYISMYEDINDALKDILPKIKMNYDNLGTKIKEKYQLQEVENVLEVDDDE